MSTQTGAFLPGLLKQVELLDTSAETTEGQKKSEDEKILELNVVLVYKRLVQGLIYSPPDCDKYLALDAKPQGSVWRSDSGPDSGTAPLGFYGA